LPLRLIIDVGLDQNGSAFDMDVTAVNFSILDTVRQAVDAGRAQGAAIVQTLRQGQQIAAAEGLSFATQSLAGAATGANLVRLFGGDGRPILQQAQSALATADGDVKTLRGFIVADASSGVTTGFAAQQQLDGLDTTVQRLSGLAQAVIDSPVGDRPDATGQKPDRAVAAMRGSLADMGNAIAAGRFALIAPVGVDVTV
jgi:hypothetical protein